jgi:hypothetical protein
MEGGHAIQLGEGGGGLEAFFLYLKALQGIGLRLSASLNCGVLSPLNLKATLRSWTKSGCMWTVLLHLKYLWTVP